MVRGGAGCSGEKWKGIKLNRRASHIPGGGRLLHRGCSGSRGWQRRTPRGPKHAGLHGAQEPAWTSGHHGGLVGGSSASLRPGTTSGFSPPAHPGWQGAGRSRGGLGAICARFALAASGGGAGAREPKEQRSAAGLDQSPRRSSPWQLQHQARPPRGALAAKSPTRRSAPTGLQISRGRNGPFLASAGNLEICC